MDLSGCFPDSSSTHSNGRDVKPIVCWTMAFNYTTTYFIGIRAILFISRVDEIWTSDCRTYGSLKGIGALWCAMRYSVNITELFIEQIWIHRATVLVDAATNMLNVKQLPRALITHVSVRAITQLLEEFAKQVNHIWNKYILVIKLDHM
jgi:hypothetical protein